MQMRIVYSVKVFLTGSTVNVQEYQLRDMKWLLIVHLILCFSALHVDQRVKFFKEVQEKQHSLDKRIQKLEEKLTNKAKNSSPVPLLVYLDPPDKNHNVVVHWFPTKY